MSLIKIKRAMIVSCLWLAMSVTEAAEVMRVVSSEVDDQPALSIQLSAPVSYVMFQLEKPDRFVIDISDSSLRSGALSGFQSTSLIKKARFGSQNHKLRLVFELNHPVVWRTRRISENDHVQLNLYFKSLEQLGDEQRASRQDEVFRFNPKTSEGGPKWGTVQTAPSAQAKTEPKGSKTMAPTDKTDAPPVRASIPSIAP